MILSAALLLDWFHQRGKSAACREAASLMRRAVEAAIAGGTATRDLGRTASTGEFAEAVVRKIGR